MNNNIDNIDIDNIDDIPLQPKLYRLSTTTGLENVIDSDTGLPMAIEKYYSIENKNFKTDNEFPRPYYTMLFTHRNKVIDNIILIINIINSEKNLVLNIIHTYIKKYIFYKNDLLLVDINISKYCKKYALLKL